MCLVQKKAAYHPKNCMVHGETWWWRHHAWHHALHHAIAILCFSLAGSGAVVKKDGNIANTDLSWPQTSRLLVDIFQHDNNPKPKFKSPEERLQEKKISILKWSSQSPERNSTENLWNDLKRGVPSSLNDPSMILSLFNRSCAFFTK